MDLKIAAPQRQSRLKVAFRIVLGIPSLMIAGALTSSGARNYGAHVGLGLLGVGAFLGWFATLALGRMPRGLRDAIAYALSYTAQLDAYLLLLPTPTPTATRRARSVSCPSARTRWGCSSKAISPAVA